MPGPRIVGAPFTVIPEPKLNVVVLSNDVNCPRTLTVRFCAPCIPDPGSTMLRYGWATTTVKPAVSTSVEGILEVPVVVKVRSLNEAVAVGLTVTFA
jgi:hypothetical protein